MNGIPGFSLFGNRWCSFVHLAVLRLLKSIYPFMLRIKFRCEGGRVFQYFGIVEFAFSCFICVGGLLSVINVRIFDFYFLCENMDIVVF